MRRIALLAGAFAAAQAIAQVVVPPAANPGAIQQQQIEEQRRREELERAQRKPSGPLIRETPPASPATPEAGAVRFFVREIRFTRSEILKPQELQALAHGYQGREVSLAELQQLVEKVNALYRSKGVVTARAVLPPQDVTSGVVEIRLVEGRVGRVGIEGNASTRASYIENRLDLEAGRLVDLPALEKSLVRFNRTNDVQLHADLRPGETFGTTDVQVQAAEPPRQQLNATLDDNGTPATGRVREGLSYLNRSVFGFRDDLSASLTRADGQSSRALSYGFPFDTWGGRISFAYYADDTAIKHGALASLDITGLSQARILSVRQPVYVSGSAQLDLLAGSRQRAVANWTDTILLQRTETRDNNFGFELQLYGEKSFWLANLTRYVGTAKVLGENTYGINRGSLYYNRDLGRGYSIRGGLNWQSTQQQGLPPSEQFFIGGDGSVRAYPVGTYAGDTGDVLNLELHHPLWNGAAAGQKIAASGFFFLDYGVVEPFLPPGSTQNPHPHLAALGWGMNANLGSHLYGRVSFGYGLTNVPSQPRHYEVLFQIVASAF